MSARCFRWTVGLTTVLLLAAPFGASPAFAQSADRATPLAAKHAPAKQTHAHKAAKGKRSKSGRARKHAAKSARGKNRDSARPASDSATKPAK